MSDDGHERFRILMVDEVARLYRFVQSDRTFHDACIIRDLLREWNGGHWIIVDGPNGRCVADTRPRAHDVSVETRPEVVALPTPAAVSPSVPRPPRGRRQAIEVD